jgi:hypothetical protein
MNNLKKRLDNGKMPKVNIKKVGKLGGVTYDGQLMEWDGSYYFVPIESIRKYIGNAQHVVCFGKKSDYKVYKTFTGLVKYLKKQYPQLEVA